MVRLHILHGRGYFAGCKPCVLAQSSRRAAVSACFAQHVVALDTWWKLCSLITRVLSERGKAILERD